MKVPEVDVCIVDKNASRIAAWNSTCPPINEPGLVEVVQMARGLGPGCTSRRCNLNFSTDIDKEVREADVIFIAVETPSTAGEVTHPAAGLAPDMTNFYAAIKQVAQTAVRDFILVNKSTLPCGTAQETMRVLRTLLRPGVHCEVLSNPEFLAEGTAIQDLLSPDRVLIGSSDTDSGRAAAEYLADLYAHWVARDKIMTMRSQSCELSKLAANALLSQRISSINALSAVCEELGADIREVSSACGLDQRIGASMLNATIGFGGSCFKKDVLHLTWTASELGLQAVASYFGSIVTVNSYQTERCIKRIIRHVPKNATVAILGFAFKPKTGDTRESPAIKVVRSLALAGYSIRIFEPLVNEVKIMNDVRESLNGLAHIADERVSVGKDICNTCRGASAIAVLNTWEGLRLFPTGKNLFTTKHALPRQTDSC
jgi:UDPglucose 6-dehydrogenase